MRKTKNIYVVLCAFLLSAPVWAASVAQYGAKCDGKTDDRAAIQQAMDATAAAGGGTVDLPGSTCLLDSFVPQDHPWNFYNLRVPSGVTLSGTTGTRLLQGPHGRQTLDQVPGATFLANAVLAVGNHPSLVTFKDGPFYPLHAMSVGSHTVTLQNASDAAKFKPGDYAAIYEHLTGDVLPGQMSQIRGVSGATLTLEDAVLRGFAAAQIANVTANAAHDVGLRNLIVQGAEPLMVTETWRLNVADCAFLADTSIPDNSHTDQMNTMEHVTFTNSTFAPLDSATYFPYIELGQRNSSANTWVGNSFTASSVGFGEYAGEITLTGNHFFLHPHDLNGVSLGGMNVLFAGNDIHTIGNITSGSGWGFVLTDVYGCCGYTPYTGHIQIVSNQIDCAADGNNCLLLQGIGTVASGNTITDVGNWATGIYISDATALVTGNKITTKANNGITLVSYGGVDSATIAGNTITGPGPTGIAVANLSGAPPAGGHQIRQNTITGFTTAISIDPLMHPGTLLIDNQ
jgi:hypothetical protein